MQRILSIEPYIQNQDELHAKDQLLNKIRVCVLGIPKTLSEVDFFNLFNVLFGNVKRAYIKENKRKTKNLGFVTFEHEENAQACLNYSKVRLSQNHTLSIKKFTAKTKKPHAVVPNNTATPLITHEVHSPKGLFNRTDTTNSSNFNKLADSNYSPESSNLRQVPKDPNTKPREFMKKSLRPKYYLNLNKIKGYQDYKIKNDSSGYLEDEDLFTPNSRNQCNDSRNNSSLKALNDSASRIGVGLEQRKKQ